jgi:hypothetical protein
MKSNFLLAGLLLTLTASVFAQDLPGDDEIVQSQEFKGEDGRMVKALVVTDENEDSGSLYIVDTSDSGEEKITLVNGRLGLSTTQFPDFADLKILSVNPQGSLEINQSNEFDENGKSLIFTRKLTIGYRDGAYRLIGFTYKQRSRTLRGQDQACDYNFPARRGTKNGAKVQLINAAISPAVVTLHEEHVVDCDKFATRKPKK